MATNNNDEGIKSPQDLLVFINADSTVTNMLAQHIHDDSGLTRVGIFDSRTGEQIETNAEAAKKEGYLVIACVRNP